ncbi:MAG TPA: glycogen synthase GlgA [Acidobacteriaceae bacterium]|jgi:starch synthase|nr:glycogen synthase GlgA [Acidobacteriaceae bacterium]
MHIVFAASECAPYAKTGGLADVVAALPPALAEQGHRVTIFLPYYRTVAKQIPDPPVVLPSLTIPFPSYNRFVRILDGGKTGPNQGNVQLFLVDCPEMFDRDGFYGTPSGDYGDNAERFGLYCRAVIEASKILGVPDVFHVHDWQAAMLAVMLRSIYFFDPMLRSVPCVLTIHNAGYQGWFPPRTMETLLLPWDMFTMDKLEQYDNVNFLKGGIVYADAITTVSRKYAEEIQTAEFGAGLETMLQRRSGDLVGILNGVDYVEWNPETDSHIAAHYSPTKPAGKKECRRDLLHLFGMEAVKDETAILGIVSRFATQKGFDLIEQIADELMQEDVALLVLGTGEPYFENLFRELSARYPHKMRVKVGYDNVTAHKIEAGADIFLMPSRYEPCGLNQIYSLKYGTVPVVRATGGLDDTIAEAHEGQGNGFKFHGYDPKDLLDAIRRALAVRRQPKQWLAMMQRGMKQNFSWEQPAREYVQVYERVVRQRAW